MAKKPLTRLSDSLPLAECEQGYSESQLNDIFGEGSEELKAFNKWMAGQTCSLCEGKKYNHERREYEPSCDGVAHGLIIYSWDLIRYIDCGYSKVIWD